MDLQQHGEANESHLDSHADTCAGGSNFVQLDDSPTRFVDVSPFSEEYAPMKDIPIASCATAWVCPETGQTRVLVFHQMLYFGDKLLQSLLCPNQMRDHGTLVDDTPIQWDHTSKHGITMFDEDHANSIFIPLKLHGVFSYANTRKPTKHELETCKFYIATSPNEWNPYSNKFQEAEARDNVRLDQPKNGDSMRLQYLEELSIPRNLSACSTDINEKIYDHLQSDPRDGLLQRIQSLRIVSDIHKPTIPSDDAPAAKRKRPQRPPIQVSDTICSEDDADHYRNRTTWGPSSTPSQAKGLTPEVLSKRWGVSINKAKDTIKVTTQKGIRNLANPMMRRMKTQRWRTKRRLQGKWFSDTAHFPVKSILQQSKAAQVFTNAKGYDEFIPIENESMCSDALVQFINEVGVPEHLVVDGARAQGSHETYNTKWGKVVKQGHIHQTWIQPHCWWQNGAERVIGEIRKDMRHTRTSKGSPKRLWGFLGQFIAGKRQRTASTIPHNMGRTPFELVHGYTPDISLYACHEWYEFF